MWLSLDASWSKDHGFYVSPNGGGAAIGNRYQTFGEWLKKGEPVEMPEVSYNESLEYKGGGVSFGNGRHRFAWLRDHGVKKIPVCVPEEQTQKINELFGIGKTKPTKTFVVAWGEHKSDVMGKVYVDAKDEKEARRLFKKNYIDTRAFGWGKILICYVYEKNSS